MRISLFEAQSHIDWCGLVVHILFLCSVKILDEIYIYIVPTLRNRLVIFHV